MDDLNYSYAKKKSFDIINILSYQCDFKYKFRPDAFFSMITNKDKSSVHVPQSCKYFKRLTKFKQKGKLKCRSKSKKNKVKALAMHQNIKPFKDEHNCDSNEAKVIENINSLKKKGLWSRDALPKVMEPRRCRSYWDYLLDEAIWLSADMRMGLHWKISAAKVLAEHAKAFLLAKRELAHLESVQMQELARLHCSQISKMIREFWDDKNGDSTLLMIKNPQIKKEIESKVVDNFQIWYSQKLISADANSDLSDFDKSDSDSLCSFDSSSNSSSGEFSVNAEDVTENNLDSNEITSFDLVKEESKMDFSEELYSNVNCDFLSTNVDIHNTVYDFENIVNRISLQRQLIRNVHEYNLKTAFNFSDYCFYKVSDDPFYQSNIRYLSELVEKRCSFCIMNDSSYGYEKMNLIGLFSFLSRTNGKVQKPNIIITTMSSIHDWKYFLSKMYPTVNLIVLDFCSPDDIRHVRLINWQQSLICLTTYLSFMSNAFPLDVEWLNVVFDKTEKMSENYSRFNDKLSRIRCCQSKIVISTTTDVFNNSNVLQNTFNMLFSPQEFNEIESHYFSIDQTVEMEKELKTILLDLSVELNESSLLNYDCRIIMCELVGVQNKLHQFIMDKLKISLESRNLVDLVEIISQDIQVSQHPNLFDIQNDDADKFFFNSVIKDSKSEFFLDKFVLPLHMEHPLLSSVLLPKLEIFIEDRFNDISHLLSIYNDFDMTDQFYKYDLCRLKKLLVSFANLERTINGMSESSNLDDSSRQYRYDSPFLSSKEIEQLNTEKFSVTQSTEMTSIKPQYNGKIYTNGDIYDDNFSLTSALSLRQYSEKYKSQIAALCKENEFLLSRLNSNYYNLKSCRKSIICDYNYRISDSSVLENLKKVSSNYNNICSGWTGIYQPKIISDQPELDIFKKIKFNRIKENVFQVTGKLLEKNVSVINRIYVKSNSLVLSGKMKILDFILKDFACDTSVKGCILISHSFEFLNLIETMIYANEDYRKFTRLRLYSSSVGSHQISTIVNKFNKSKIFGRKPLLLIHSRTNDFSINHLMAGSCIVVVVDTSLQIDSESLINNLIKRWYLNIFLSAEDDTLPKILRLCSFNSVEQYFMKNDLSFLYKNSYYEKGSSNSSLSAKICQRSLLKNFVEKLDPFLKEKLISGFYIDDLPQSPIHHNKNALRPSRESLNNIMNSFENPYDMLHICWYNSKRKADVYEMKFFESIANSAYTSQQLNNDECGVEIVKFSNEDSNNSTKVGDIFTKWENIRRKRQKCDIFSEIDIQSDLLFYHQEDELPKELKVWDPPLLDECFDYVPIEITDLYDLNPIPESDLPLCVVPSKDYVSKCSKIVDEKPDIFTVKSVDETSFKTLGFDEPEKFKKRKLSHSLFDTSSSDYCQFGPVAKRRIFSNRRYFTDHDRDLDGQETRFKMEKKVVDSEPPVLDLKDIEPTTIKKQSPYPSIDIEPVSYQPTPVATVSTISNIIPFQSTDTVRSSVITLSTFGGCSKLTIPKPFYSREGLKTHKLKRQFSSGNIPNITKSNCLSGPAPSPYSNQKLFLNTKAPILLQPKSGVSQDVNLITNTNLENDIDIKTEWAFHEEALIYQSLQLQEFSLPMSNSSEKSSSGSFSPNFTLVDFYLNHYTNTTAYRSTDMCKHQFNKLVQGLQTTHSYPFMPNLSRSNSNASIGHGSNTSSNSTKSSIVNPSGCLDVKGPGDSKSVVGMSGRKLKIKMKHLPGTYGTVMGHSAHSTQNKIKVFHHILNEMKMALTQDSQVVNSCLNTYDNRTNIMVKMLDEVLNKNKIPSLHSNHSQTIKKNATHTSALEENNIHPDKIFTPAMLIQRREELNKESKEREQSDAPVSSFSNNSGRTQTITPGPANYRTPTYFETATVSQPVFANSLGSLRKTISTNPHQNYYSVQAAPVSTGNTTYVPRGRFTVPVNRHAVSGTAGTVSQLPATCSVVNPTGTGGIMAASAPVTIGTARNPTIQFQQHQAGGRSSTATSVQQAPRRSTSQVVLHTRFVPQQLPAASAVRQNVINRHSGPTNAFGKAIGQSTAAVLQTPGGQVGTGQVTILHNAAAAVGGIDPSSVTPVNAGGRGLSLTTQIRTNANIRGNIAASISTGGGGGSSTGRGNIPRVVPLNGAQFRNMGNSRFQSE